MFATTPDPGLRHSFQIDLSLTGVTYSAQPGCYLWQQKNQHYRYIRFTYLPVCWPAAGRYFHSISGFVKRPYRLRAMTSLIRSQYLDRIYSTRYANQYQVSTNNPTLALLPDYSGVRPAKCCQCCLHADALHDSAYIQSLSFTPRW